MYCLTRKQKIFFRLRETGYQDRWCMAIRCAAIKTRSRAVSDAFFLMGLGPDAWRCLPPSVRPDCTDGTAENALKEGRRQKCFMHADWANVSTMFVEQYPCPAEHHWPQSAQCRTGGCEERYYVVLW